MNLCLLLTLQQARCCKHGRRWTTATISQVVTKSPYPWFFSARATKRARLDVTPKTTEQNRIVCTSKSEAEETSNIKKLRSRYCTIDAMKLTTDRHEASRGFFATEELLVNSFTMRANSS